MSIINIFVKKSTTMKKFIYLSLLVLSVSTLTGCSATKDAISNFNLFSIQDDKDLGAQVAGEIDNNPKEYSLVDSSRYAAAYKYLYDIRDRILNSGKVTHKDDFEWRLRIINNDTILNAFCTPGGYIYVYTGLIRYLDSEDELAGVLAHEIGHADLRHSTSQMTKLYGVDELLGLIGGEDDYEMLKNITENIVGLKFSRSNESAADEASVTYLCPTDYPADAGAKFFEKMEAAGNGSSAPIWLSTHPDPKDRIEHFHTVAISLGCSGNKTFVDRYKKLQMALPLKMSTLH